MKYNINRNEAQLNGCSPHGERGLKFAAQEPILAERWSLPTRGAGIEILMRGRTPTQRQSLPTRGAGIEIDGGTPLTTDKPQSLPTRGAGIEIRVIMYV